jgi:Rrf2 family protein
VKLSSKGRYAVQAVFDLAYHNEGKAAQIKDVCDRQNIPSRFLEQVFQDLKRAGIVRSKRGPRGGYRLSRPIRELTVGEIVRAIEGPLTLGAFEAHTSSGSLLTAVFTELSAQLDACFDALTIAELCARAEQQGLARALANRYVYAI